MNGAKRKMVVTSFIVVGASLIAFFILSNRKEKLEKRVGESTNIVKSIAVLPFVDMNEQGKQEYLSDGLTEGILNSLAQLKGLKVTARTSSFQFKGKEFDVREAGKILGVRTILEGSLQRNGNRIRITAQLINVEDGFHFWSEQYDENIDDIFVVQDKIARAIAGKLEITLLEKGNNNNIRKTPTHGKEAYELYAKGRTSWNLRTPPELKKGIEFFNQAIELDSSFAKAYSAVFPPLNIPTWTLTFIIILVLLGFPIALILAWAYEVSPDSKIQKNSFKENFSSNNRKNPLTRSLVISFLVAIAAASVIYFKFYHQ